MTAICCAYFLKCVFAMSIRMFSNAYVTLVFVVFINFNIITRSLHLMSLRTAFAIVSGHCL